MGTTLGNLIQFLSKEIATIDVESSLVNAVDLMKKRETGSVLIREGDELIGIFTERDLLTRVNLNDPAGIASIKIRDVMTEGLTTIDHTEPYTNAIELMQEQYIRHMPVVKDGKIIGIVSLRTLLIEYQTALQGILRTSSREFGITLNELKHMEEKFSIVFHNADSAITVANSEERLISFNPYTLVLFEAANEKELLGKHVKDLYPPKIWSKIRSENIRKLGIKNKLPIQIMTRTNKKVKVEISISVLRDIEGDITGSIAIIKRAK